MFTIIGILVLSALVAAILSIMGKCPLYVSVLFLCIVEALQILPLGG